MNILIIDDDEEMRLGLCEMLTREGHTVLFASDGRMGMQILTQNSVDLVVTDIFMPEKEGLETIRDIRKVYPDINIIAISGGGNIGSKHCLTYAKGLGAHQVLAKPFTKNELLSVIDTLHIGVC